MTSEQELREKLRKIAALFEGATTVGEREAAAAALNRVRTALNAAEETQPIVEFSFRLPDLWNRRLFLALTSGTGLRFIIEHEKGKKTCELGKALRVLHTLGIDITLSPPSSRSHVPNSTP
jgi:hypothetical protein